MQPKNRDNNNPNAGTNQHARNNGPTQLCNRHQLEQPAKQPTPTPNTTQQTRQPKWDRPTPLPTLTCPEHQNNECIFLTQPSAAALHCKNDVPHGFPTFVTCETPQMCTPSHENRRITCCLITRCTALAQTYENQNIYMPELQLHIITFYAPN